MKPDQKLVGKKIKNIFINSDYLKFETDAMAKKMRGEKVLPIKITYIINQ